MQRLVTEFYVCATYVIESSMCSTLKQQLSNEGRILEKAFVKYFLKKKTQILEKNVLLNKYLPIK